ncbi:hypothetical protein Tco_1500163 [Tanacetum coccineum]
MYNAILDKYVESLELGNNGTAFIQSEMPKKMKDLKLFILPCRLDMEKDPMCPLLVGRGILATASAVINCKKSKIAVGITRSIFKVREIVLGHEDTPYWTTIARQKSYEPRTTNIDWNKPPKEVDGAWHIRIELTDPDGEKFDLVFQSIPTTRKLSEKEKPSDILDLEHFYDA